MKKGKLKLIELYLPALQMTVGYAELTTGGYGRPVGVKRNGCVADAIPNHQMITWQFKCLNCGYKFTAEEPKKLFDAYNKCLMCNSKNFIKKEIK